MTRTARVLVALALLAACIPEAAHAVLPRPGHRFVAHEHHATAGAGWHVELKVDRPDSSRLRLVALYDEACGETVTAEHLALSPAGDLVAGGTFRATDRKGRSRRGTWEVQATFPTPKRVDGVFRLREPGCEARRAFSVDDGGVRHPLGYPDLDAASLGEWREAERLRRLGVAAAWRFSTLALARARGFRRGGEQWPPPPGAFHLWRRDRMDDAHVMDPRRPESLVFWQPTDPGAEPVLLAYMFRVRPGERPSLGGTIPMWHSHRPGGDEMTHLWLTRDVRSAFANCLPVPELTLALPAFRYEPVPARVREATACPQPA